MSAAELLRLVASTSLALTGGLHATPKSPEFTDPNPPEPIVLTCDGPGITITAKDEGKMLFSDKDAVSTTIARQKKSQFSPDSLIALLYPEVTAGNRPDVDQIRSDLNPTWTDEVRHTTISMELAPGTGLADAHTPSGITVRQIANTLCGEGTIAGAAVAPIESVATQNPDTASIAPTTPPIDLSQSLESAKETVSIVDSAMPDWAIKGLEGLTALLGGGVLAWLYLATRRNDKDESSQVVQVVRQPVTNQTVVFDNSESKVPVAPIAPVAPIQQPAWAVQKALNDLHQQRYADQQARQTAFRRPTEEEIIAAKLAESDQLANELQNGTGQKDGAARIEALLQVQRDLPHGERVTQQQKIRETSKSGKTPRPHW